MRHSSCPLKEEFEAYLKDSDCDAPVTSGSAMSYSSFVSSVFAKIVPKKHSNADIKELLKLLQREPAAAASKNDALTRHIELIDTYLDDPITTASINRATLADYRSGFEAYKKFLTHRFYLTISADTLARRFKGRLRTQDRLTNDSSKKPCFPIDFILWAANRIDKESYRRILDTLDSAANNAHVMTGNGAIHTKDIERMKLDRQRNVCVEVEGVTYQVYTATSQGSVIKMPVPENCSAKDDIGLLLRDMHLDHFTPISNIIEKDKSLLQLMALTRYIEKYAGEHGLPFNTKAADFRKLTQAMKNDDDYGIIEAITPMFPGLADETCRLLKSTTFTLMYGKENISKGNEKN